MAATGSAATGSGWGGVRRWLTLLHRWVGLAIAAFLVVSGATGAVISWDGPLDRWLNPRFFAAVAPGPALPPLELLAAVERRDPRVRVSSLPMAAEPGGTVEIGVEGRVDAATGRPFEPGYNQVYLDPASGAELGRREWGRAWPVTRESLLPFLYRLHYSLHVPAMWGIPDWGTWLMGGVALLWTADCFVGLCLTLPRRRRRAGVGSGAGSGAGHGGRGWLARWRPAWLVKTGSSGFRTTFDLHRAAGLWTWGLLVAVAFTGFSMNLYREVFFPVLSAVSAVTPTPFDTRAPRPANDPAVPAAGFAAVLRRAEAAGGGRPVGSLRYDSRFDLYTARLFGPGGEDGPGGAGAPALYFDGATGAALGGWAPWTGTAADLFAQAQFPLHSGRILGLPGRIAVSALGVAVCGLSVTGVAVWWRKRAGRVRRRRGTAAAG